MKILFVLAVLIFGFGLEARVVESIRAVVNNDIITQTDVQAYRHRVQKDLSPDVDLLPLTDKKTLLKNNSSLLEHMVYEKLLDQDARKLGLEASPAQVNQHIRKRRQAVGLSLVALKRRLRQQKISWAEYEGLMQQQLTRQMWIHQHLASQIHISNSEVQSYYMQNYKKPLEFRYQLVHILFSSSLDRALSLAEEAYQRIQGGEDFNLLSQEYKAMPKVSSGVLDSLTLSQMSLYLRRNVQSLNTGQVSKIIKAPHGYQIIKVVDKSLISSPHLEKARPLIVQKLFGQALLVRLREHLAHRRQQSFIQTH